jgi:hypothetical protein
VLVLSHLANIGSDGSLLKEAKDLADLIPSVVDRMDRYTSLASDALHIDDPLSRNILKESASLLKDNLEAHAKEDRKKRVVDLAYRIDPELASSLASSLDQDDARMVARRRLQTLEAKKKLADGEYRTTEAGRGIPQDLPDAAVLTLGALNANRIEPKPVKYMREFFVLASQGDLDEAYPVLSWLIENAIHRRG